MTQIATEHLNDYELSRIACGDIRPSTAAEHHLAGCRDCRDRVSVAEKDVQAMKYAPIPRDLLELNAKKPAIKTAPHTPLIWMKVASGLAVAAALVLVMQTVGTQQADEEVAPIHLKGEPELAISIKRNGALVVDDLPLKSAQPRQAGDQIRLRLIGQGSPWVIVLFNDNNTWVDNFHGAPPVDGWLPFALEITSQEATAGKVVMCPRELLPSVPLSVGKGVDPQFDGVAKAAGCTEYRFSL